MAFSFLPKIDVAPAILPCPLIVPPEMSMREVITLMGQRQDNCCLVTESSAVDFSLLNQEQASCVLSIEEGKLVGILTERDIVRCVAAGTQLEQKSFAEIMTRQPVTLKRSQLQDIFAVLNLFQTYGIRHLPIVNEEGYPIGLVTATTIRQLLRPADLLRMRTVAEMMITDVIQASTTTSVLGLAQQMAKYRVSCVVITESDPDTGSRPVGLVTERDIVQFQALGLDYDKIQAQAVMSTPLFCLSPEQLLWEAHEQMQRWGVQRLVVTSEQQGLLGIITQTSVLQALDPVAMYATINFLQERVEQLESEKVALLEKHNADLERQVQERTAKLRQQANCDRLLTTLCQRIRESLELETILQTTVSQVQQHLEADRVVVYEFGCDWSGEIVAEAIASGCSSLLGHRIYDPCFAETWVSRYSHGQIHVIEDIYQANLTACHIELLQGLGIRANLIVPIVHNQQLWGLLCVHHCHVPRHWDCAEVDLLKKLATQIAIAIQQSQLYQQTQIELRERQQVEHQLQQQRNFGSAILEVVGSLVVVLDSQGRILQFNQACEQITGYQFEEVKGEFLWDRLLVSPEASEIKAIFDNLKTQPISRFFEKKWKTKDGKICLIDFSNAVLTNEEGEIDHVVLTGIDITKRRRMEEGLRNIALGISPQSGERFFQSLVHYLGKVLDISYTFVAEIVHSLPKKLKTIAVCQDGVIIDNFEYELKQSSDQNIIEYLQEKLPTLLLNHFDCQLKLFIPIFDSDEQIIGVLSLLGKKQVDDSDFLTEIVKIFSVQVTSELKRTKAETALKKLNEDLEIRVEKRTAELKESNVKLEKEISERQEAEFALAKSQQFLRNIIDTAPNLMFVQDCQGKFILVNQALANIYGKTVENMVGKTEAELNFPYQNHLTLTDSNAIASLNPSTMCERKVTDVTGKTRYFQVIQTLLTSSNGEKDQILAVATDITERKQAEQEIQKMLEKEKELNTLKSRFISMTSHEFRTPLAVIASSAGILKEFGYKLDEEKKQKHLQCIQNYVQHTTQLLDDILLIDKVQTEQLNFQPNSLNLISFCTNLVEEFQSTTLKRRLTFTYPQATSIIGHMDQKLLREILANLISNAIKYSPEGGTINVTLESAEGAAIFKVEDQGIGIPLEDQSHLFDLFYRGGNVGNIQGNGLGLSIVSKCLYLQGGKITIDSTVGGGTTCTVILPLVKDDDC